jgi:translation initiation factor 4G
VRATSSSSSVSLRPGGGRAAFSLRPLAASSLLSDDVASVANNANNPRRLVSQGAHSDGFAAVFRLGGRRERIRYTRDVLLQFQELWTQAPDELVESSFDGLMSVEGSLVPEDDWVRRDRRVVGITGEAAAAVTVEPDSRDWRARNPPPPQGTLQQHQQQQQQHQQQQQQQQEDRAAREQQWDRTPNKQRNDRNDRYERDRNENNGRGSREQTTSQAFVPQQQQQQQQSQQQENGPTETRAVMTIAKAANPWSARRGAQSEKEKVFRTVKGILNKLTPEKYDVLLEQMMQAGISSAEILQGVISLIFDKAVLEPSFCSMYAQLCVNLSKELPEFPAEQPGEKPVTFRRVLLNTCQEEFEGADALRAEIRQMTKPEQVRERADKEKLVKLRTLGNIKLIGELFKQKMLPEKIVHACIQELLGSDTKSIPAEENVEALCQLFSTVGKQLEESAMSRVAFDTYFARLKDICGSKSLPARIKFMVRDILDLRSNKWIPRHEEVKAKRINEIHAEAEQKLGLRPGMMQMRNGRTANAPGLANMPGGYMPGAGGMMPGMPGMPGMSAGLAGGMPGAPLLVGYMAGLEADGWETVSVGRKTKRETMGVLPVPMAMPGMGAVAPASRYPAPPMQGTGVGPRVLPQGSGGYGFLGKPSALIGSGNAGSNLLSRQSGPLEPQGGQGPVGSPAQEFAKETTRMPPPPPAQPPLTGQLAADLPKKTQSLLNEFFSVVDLNEALLCVEELKAPDFYPELVRMALSLALDRRDRECALVLKLLVHLNAKAVILSQDLRAGVLQIAEQLEDVAMDAPRAPKQFGEMVAGLILAGASELRLLLEVCGKVEDPSLRESVFGFAFGNLKLIENEPQLVSVSKTASLDREVLLRVVDEHDLAKLLS